MPLLEGRRVLVTGGTGSLGQVLIRRLLQGELGHPAKILVLSRDEAKQHNMRVEYLYKHAVTEEVIYRNFRELLEFRVGDVRDFHSVAAAMRGADVVINAAALKQVPTCEACPFEAVKTNIAGPENIVRAIQELDLPVGTVVGVSTDKACKPVNVMGMTKAIQERVFIQGNLRCPTTRFICVRYGNVLASRGVGDPALSRSDCPRGTCDNHDRGYDQVPLGLDEAVDTIFAALRHAARGENVHPTRTVGKGQGYRLRTYRREEYIDLLDWHSARARRSTRFLCPRRRATARWNAAGIRNPSDAA